MDKRVIIALVVSLVILVGYQALISKYYPQPAVSKVYNTPVTEQPKPVEEYQKEIPPPKNPVITDEKEQFFKNDLYTVIFTDIGAGIKKITLNENKKDGLNLAYDIFDAKDPLDSLMLISSGNNSYDLNAVKYDIKSTKEEITFTHNFNNEFIVEKKYRFYNSLYRIDLDINWKNLKGMDISKKYSLVSNVHFPSSSVMDERYIEITASLDGKVSKNKKSGRPFELQKIGAVSWVMLKNRYFSMITKPYQPTLGYSIAQNKYGKIAASLNMQPFEIASNSAVDHKYSIYIGPSEPVLVKNANIGVEGALSYGVLGSIGQMLMAVLKFFYKVTRNWGVSVILLAFFINIILYPLTRKSYKSMHDLQILQPKMEKLRQENKNNPQKLQKEIMELYKKHKVNPMGGCLPLILQMPIFFALYQGLINFLQLRGAKFLWIRDLSLSENIKMPISLPLLGNSINILPLLMIVGMYFQQRLTNKLTAMSQTDEQRQQQKIMVVVMTVMFGFIFYSMPSGFVLYWLSSTVIMTVIQFMLTRNPVHVEANA